MPISRCVGHAPVRGLDRPDSTQLRYVVEEDPKQPGQLEGQRGRFDARSMSEHPRTPPGRPVGDNTTRVFQLAGIDKTTQNNADKSCQEKCQIARELKELEVEDQRNKLNFDPLDKQTTQSVMTLSYKQRVFLPQQKIYSTCNLHDKISKSISDNQNRLRSGPKPAWASFNNRCAGTLQRPAWANFPCVFANLILFNSRDFPVDLQHS